jgi:hypothetical protein
MVNERINELRLEAGISRLHEVPYLVAVNKEGEIIDPLDGLQKFAELIVAECLLCCERTISDPVPKSVDTFEQGGIHCIDEIRQHFGVGMTTEDKKILIKELLGVKNV